MPDEPSGAPALSRRMRIGLASETMLFRQPKADRRELEAIRAILARRDRGKAEISLAAAMRIVADSDPSEATAEAIAKVLGDAGVDESTRLLAAALLGDIPARASTKALVGLLGKGDAPMELVALRGLARIGDARADTAIAGLGKKASPALMRARGFARTAIRYRIGADPDKEAERSVMPRGAPLPIRRETPESIDATIAGYRGSTYGVRFHRQLGFGFRCAGVPHAVLVDEGLTPGRLVRDVLAKPRIAGIVAMGDGALGRFSARRIILTRPQGDGVAISIVHPSGEVALHGYMRPSGKGLALTLRDHGGERVPVQIEGIVTDDDVTLSGRLFEESAPPKRRPQRI